MASTRYHVKPGDAPIEQAARRTPLQQGERVKLTKAVP